ncbi:MAG: AAA family ATPase, partial [Myxococcota bacterium]
DIKPHNIMLLAKERTFCKVLDFGLAKPVAEEEDDLTLTGAGWLLGTPAYMAPEQLVDAKPATRQTDAWGLAVVAYETLTGQRPFLGRHQAAIGLGMLLQRFEPVTTLRPGTPTAVDGWFKQALAVDPSNRFPSVRELSRTFRNALQGEGQSRNIDGRIQVPTKLYGRDEELAVLEQAFAKANGGDSQLVLVGGYSGVGKTSLALEARRVFSERGAIFIDGKFDQFNRGTPYDCILQAFGKLMRYIVAREGASLAGWRERLDAALGDAGSVLAEVVPDLEEIIGRQAELTETSPAEARHRFQHAVSRLLQGVASAERPLVLFLDDLQWADLPSIDLLASVARDPDVEHVLVIGAFRDNEVDNAHPLHAMMKGLQGDDSLSELTLGPLGEDAVLELLTDVLGPVPGRVRLAVVCHEKTQGNPFFLRRFLETLHEEGMLNFDEDTQRWTWEHTQIISRPLGDDVVDFIAAEMKRMGEEALRALKVAACVGGEFDLGTLAFLLGVDRRRALEALRESLAADFIVPASDEIWVGEVGRQRVAFRFAHDRIQQAARSLATDEESAQVHQRVAQFMLQHLEESEREARLFELVEHLNRGSDKRAPEADPAQLRRLNLSAARRATRSAAFEPAEDYYRKARETAGPELWEDDYTQALAIHVEGARSAYLAGDRETMDRLVEEAVANARDVLDAVEAREVQIHALISEQRFREAVDLALEVLAKLGVHFPSAPTAKDVETTVGETLQALSSQPQEEIIALPLADDPRVIAMQRIQQGVMSAAYLSAPELLPLLTCRIVQLTLEDGVAMQSAYGFAVFGMVMNAAGLIDVSYQTGQIAMALLDRYDDRSMLAKTRHIVRTHINPFVEPLAESVEHEAGIFQIGMDTGDLEYAAWALHIRVAHGFYAGLELAAVQDMDVRGRSILERYQQLPALGCTLPYSQAIANCLGDVSDPARLVGPNYNAEEHMKKLVDVNFRGAAYILTIARTFVRFLYRDVEGALEVADAGGAYGDGAIATYHQVWWNQYRALAALGCMTSAAEGDLETVRENLAALEKWCGFSESNHLHRVELIRAEIARVEGREGEALKHYDAAIDHARAHRFMHEEAIANELAARFYLERGSSTPARAYLTEARAVYDEWGAQGKVRHLEQELGDVLKRARR